MLVALIDVSRKGAKCYLVQENDGLIKRLTRHEMLVLYWIVRGKSNGDIAELMGVKLSTVKTHIRNMFAKLGVYNRTTARPCAHPT